MTNCEICHFYHNQAMKFVISLCNLHGALTVYRYTSGRMITLYLTQRTEQRRNTHRIEHKQVQNTHKEGLFSIFSFKDFIYLCLERGEGKEKEKERNINV